MFRQLAALVAGAVLLLTWTQASAAPLEAYGRLPTVEDANISGDGTMLAFTVTDGESRTVVVKRLSDGGLIARLKAGDQKVRDVRWAGSEFLIVTVSKTAVAYDILGPKREYSMSIIFDIATGRQRALMASAYDSMNVVLGVPHIRRIDGDLFAFVKGFNFVDRRSRVGLFRVRLRDGDTEMVQPGLEDTTDWVVGADGEALAQTEYDQKTGDWRLRLRRGRSWPIVASDTLPIERPYLGGIGRDGQSVLLIDNARDGGQILKEYALGETSPVPVDIGPFDSLIHDPATYTLAGTYSLIGEQDRYHFFDPKAELAWKSVTKAFPGERVYLASWSDNRRRVVVEVDSPTLGPAYFLVDLDTKSATWLSDVYSGLKEADIAEVRPVSYKAADGLMLTGYLTLPRGREARNLPLVVLPHGGPASRDEPGFDWWAQALASRGYAVLQPNFRGSDGLGQALLSAGYGEFGRKMQTDLSDGVRYLASQGIADPKRVCIVGASYGGYAALAGPTLDPGVYRCAAAVAGISDLRRFMDSRADLTRTSENAILRYWSRFLGVDGRRDPDLAAISPITHVNRLDVPILLVHGKDDTVVLYNQSQVMADALKRAGKPVEFVTLKGEDHWLSRGDTRLQMLQAVVAFLEKHNPPN